ncbi:MAG: hypothetical protein IKM34_08415 [Clostridia bacterium]|nr:hypothetical protein [Clostridia bacterium]
MSDIRRTIRTTSDERGKNKEQKANTQKRKFTALDFFFVVVLLLCVLGIGFRGTIAEFFLRAEPTERVRISFKTDADNLNENEVLEIEKGKEFFFDDKKHHSFGVVEKVEVKEELKGYSAIGTIVMDARYTDSGLVSKDNRSVRVGETFNICAGNYTVCVQITEIPRK